MSPGGNEKRARLISISELIKSGHVVFPKRAAENLINQLLWFGSEKYDDLVDALVFLVLKIFEREEHNRITFSRIHDHSADTLTQEQLEKEADELTILYQQGMRGDKRALKHYYELLQRRPDPARELEGEYERRNFNRMMGKGWW